jgi:hypothetical protein
VSAAASHAVLVRALLDDAATFPPGSMDLAEAVAAHRGHLRSLHAPLVGPFVVAAAALPRLADLLSPDEAFEVTVTTPDVRELPMALATAAGVSGVRVVALEAALPDDVGATEVVPTVRAAAVRGDVTVFVEVPRDGRRDAVVAALSGSGYAAKLRTGGVVAEAYPDVDELAHAVVALVEAGVPFKATAGLHHAVRNTDPVTGFDQHGFANVLAAVDTVQRGGSVADAVAALSERNPSVVAMALLSAADRAADVRAGFRSFGTCSIAEPVADLEVLGFGVRGAA